MIKLIIGSGLILIPFFVMGGFDSRQPKLYLAIVLSLILSLNSFHKGLFKPFKNVWCFLFLSFIPINFLMSPNLGVRLFNMSVGPFWILQSFLFILIFFLAHISVKSITFKRDDVAFLLKIMSWVGVIMASYSLVQFMGFEQFFTPRKEDIYNISNACGTMGNRLLLASFIAMIIPISIYLKKYVHALIMFIVVFICNSQIVGTALIVSMMFLVGTKHRLLAITMACLLVISAFILGIGYFNSPGIKSFIGGGNGSNRFPAWKQMVDDLREPITLDNGVKKKFALTGFGLGSFKYLFHTRHPKFSRFYEAHNEYLEILWTVGFIGLGIFLMILYTLVRQSFPLDRLNAHLLASFICISVCAGGMFVWHNGAILFYVIVITGLINKNKGVTHGV